ncbi:hypothetical protein [Paenibacillus sanfengchensis]|uniref:hypothetical protein n=1 Tax=Paenibacillus sanfengchensis TaxID=3119819 RepID=UPI002FDF8A26
MKKGAVFVNILVFIMVLISCSTDKPNASQPEQQIYTGYLFLEGNTLKIDDFEFITFEDKERMQELGLTEADMPNGYEIYNENEDVKSYLLADNTKFTFYDTSNLFVKEEDDKKYITTDRQKFKTFLYRGEDVPMRTPFEVIIRGNKVISISEIFVN